VKRGTPAAAADLVKYLNVEKKYGVKWLLVGNEPDLTDGIIGSPQAFAEKYVAFVDAVRAVDAAVKFVGPELLTGAHVDGIHGRPDWLTPLLTQAPGRVDGISWHYYPLDSGQKNPSSSAIMSVEHLFQETAPDWRPASIAYADEVMPVLDAARKAHAPNAGVWITEFAEDPGPGAGAGISETIAGALWVGDALGRYAEYAPAAIIRWVFKTVASHAYGLIDVNDQPRPAYGTYWLYARHMGDRYVHSVSSARTEVAVHASLRADGALAVMLVNKTTSSKRASVRVDGFCTASATDITLTGDGFGATSFEVNGQTLSSATVETIAASPVDTAKLFDVELPPTSVRVVVYRNPQ
jgi:alpha-L-arabinofuranosidase